MSKKRGILLLVFLSLFIVGTLGFFLTPTINQSLNMFTETDDGVEIAFDVFEPKNDLSLNKKAVILGHGICANKEFMRLVSKDLAEHGFVAVPFDFRGHGRSSGDFNFMGESIKDSFADGNFDQMPDLNFNTLLKDVQAIKTYLQNRGDIDMNNLGYLGYSMGGGVGFALCANDSDFKAFVGLAPVPDYMNTNLTNPQNLLVIVGQFDEAISMPLLYLVMQNKTGLPIDDIEINHLYNPTEFSNGLATKLYIDSNADHLSIPYDVDAIRETRNWYLQALKGITSFPTNFTSYYLQILFIGIGLIGGALLYLILSSSINKPKLRNNTDTTENAQTDPLDGSIEMMKKIESKSLLKSYLIRGCLLTLLCFIFGLPLFLPPLTLTGALTAFILAYSMSIYFLNKYIHKKHNLDLSLTYKSIFKQQNFRTYALGFIQGMILFMILKSTLGNIFGIVPAISELIWFPIYFTGLFVAFLNFNAFLIPLCISRHDITNIRGFIKGSLYYYLYFIGIISIIMLIPCLITMNFFLALFLLVGAVLFICVSIVSLKFYLDNKNIVVPSITIAFIFTLILMTVSPVLSIFSIL